MSNRPKIKLSSLIIIIVITAIISGITSGVIVYSSYNKNTGISYKTINSDPALKEFLEVYSSISNDYYEDINKDEMIQKAISAMLSYLGDNYTTYMSTQETNMLNDILAGEYKGIGIILEGNQIKQVLKKSPAESAGILSGDEILKINDKDVQNLSSKEAADIIKKSDNEIAITIKRGEEELNFNIPVSTLYVPAISSKIIEGTKIGYIEMATFSSSIAFQVDDALKEFDGNIDALIIDLRGNTGGFLSAAENVSSLFLKKGKTIYSLKGKNNKKVVKDTTKASTDYPIVVLVDKSTASAAEILAAALKDSYGATIVGKKTYGKGKVQQTVKLSNGSMAKYTTAKWYTPLNECIDKVGIKPDYDVDITVEKNENGEVINITDTQLSKAVEILTN